MDSTDEKIIELSKRKIAMLLLGSLLFVAAGIWFLTFDAESIRTDSGFRLLFNSPPLAYGIGLVAITVFGFFGFQAIKQFLNKKPGLIFNSSGIVDNASSASAGFIPWSDVLGSHVFEMQGQKMLVIMVKDPEKYANQGSALKRKLNQGNFNMVGSPISISSITLKTNLSELQSLFEEYHRKFGNAIAD